MMGPRLSASGGSTSTWRDVESLSANRGHAVTLRKSNSGMPSWRALSARLSEMPRAGEHDDADRQHVEQLIVALERAALAWRFQSWACAGGRSPQPQRQRRTAQAQVSWCARRRGRRPAGEETCAGAVASPRRLRSDRPSWKAEGAALRQSKVSLRLVRPRAIARHAPVRAAAADAAVMEAAGLCRAHGQLAR